MIYELWNYVRHTFAWESDFTYEGEQIQGNDLCYAMMENNILWFPREGLRRRLLWNARNLIAQDYCIGLRFSDCLFYYRQIFGDDIPAFVVDCFGFSKDFEQMLIDGFGLSHMRKKELEDIMQDMSTDFYVWLLQDLIPKDNPGYARMRHQLYGGSLQYQKGRFLI